MLIDILGAKCIGIEAVPVTVEVDIAHGIGIHLVGLADVAVKESLLRTVTALQSLGFRIPGKKIVINLAPADVRKNGSGYDLPIAVGILAASEQKHFPGLDKYLIMGSWGWTALCVKYREPCRSLILRRAWEYPGASFRFVRRWRPPNAMTCRYSEWRH